MDQFKEEKTVELWKDRSGYTLFPSDNEQAKKLLEPGAKLIYTKKARSWKEAASQMHEFLGWKPYVPEEDAPDYWKE